jgi:hypothetical protein
MNTNITETMVEAAAKAQHEAERAQHIAEGKTPPDPWDECEWPDEPDEGWTRDQWLAFMRAGLEAALKPTCRLCNGKGYRRQSGGSFTEPCGCQSP